MPTTNPLGIRLPVVSDAPDVTGDLTRTIEDESPKLVPAFNTTAERNTAFAAIGFRACTIGDIMYLRKGSTWDTVLTSTDVDTGWLGPTVSANWSTLVADPIRYRISGGRVQFKGAVFRSDGVPAAATAMVAVPSNVLPGNASGFSESTLCCPAVGTSAVGAPAKAFAALSLRPNGTVICELPYGAVSGVTKISVQTLQWAL